MNQPVEILLVEDNPADIKLTRMALEKIKLANNIQVVKDGQEAMTYLCKKDQHLASKRPDLILLDLNLPKKSGHEVLAEIKADAGLRSIPVVILTSSNDKDDINNTYNNYANCFITKPVDFTGFIDVVKCIEDFWFTIVKLPTQLS